MAFTLGTGTFTNGSKIVGGVTFTAGGPSFISSGTSLLVGKSPLISQEEAIEATIDTLKLRSNWEQPTGSYSFVATYTTENLRDAVIAAKGFSTKLEEANGLISALGNIYESSQEGLALTVSGDYFSVIGSGDIFVTLYKNDNGIAIEQESIASKERTDLSITKAGESEVSALAALVSEQAAKLSETNSSNSEVNANEDANQTALDRIATTSDRVSTYEDAAQTALDRIATSNDVISTAEDAAQTAEDRLATFSDATQTALDRIVTTGNATQTSEDRVVTGQDRVATNSDFIQTALDRIATNADTISTDNDATQTSADRSATAADVLVTRADVILSTDAASQAMANANYKGDWSSLSGGLNIPASVKDGDIIYMLNEDLADVTLSQPSLNLDKWFVLGSVTGVAPDADRLGGELPSHYATYQSVSDIDTSIISINNSISNITSSISNIDNTSDLDKPISIETQTAMDNIITNNIGNIQSQVNKNKIFALAGMVM